MTEMDSYTIVHDESQIVIGQNNRVYMWQSSNETYWPECMCPPHQRKVSVIWRCITWYGVGTLCKVDGNINAIKYCDILFGSSLNANKPYHFQDDNVSVHRAHIVGKIKQDNDIHSMIWPAQSLDLDIIENLWLCIKRSLQYPAYNINTPWNFLLPFRIYEWTCGLHPEFVKLYSMQDFGSYMFKGLPD